MNPVLKIVLYVLLVAGAMASGQRFFAQYAQRMEKASHRFEQPEATNAAPVEADGTTTGTNTTDATASTTTTTTTNSGVLTNATVKGSTHTTAATHPTVAAKPAEGSMLGVYAAVCFGCVLVVGLLLAHDVSQYIANRTHKELYNENAQGVADPEYDEAEQVWADGNHLEAIRLMREYLGKNPREVHVSLRIAEIYEKDLANPLAAALEYEEILQKKLEAERWGWAAIHLCNLYYRLDKPEQAEQLLHRIVAEYGATAAAKKARSRLGLPEPSAQTEEDASASEPVQDSAAETAQADSGQVEEGFKLPPGFRKKKG